MREFLSASTDPIFICGPCSAESREQVLACANDVEKAGVKWFRAGLWKPRTRPGCFEGVGRTGLEWLVEVKKSFGLSVCTEVAIPEHLELCLEYGIDSVWIGARTCANPFSVEELAQALKGVKNLSLLVKNPVTADVNLWLGAIERIERQGVEDVVAVHRGFTLEHNLQYRQSPVWRIPLEVKRLRPDLKIICDPSHIAGRREYIKDLSQTAANIGFDGLMIETHPDPDHAKTDSLQQICSKDISSLLKAVRFPVKESYRDEQLKIYREEIGEVDKNICSLLSDRMRLCEKIAEIKKQKNMSVFQLGQWNNVLDNLVELATRNGLDKNFIEELYSIIHQESIRIQDKTINKK